MLPKNLRVRDKELGDTRNVAFFLLQVFKDWMKMVNKLGEEE